ncbi:MAG: VWA domain-containing protein [Thermoanaerobaculia bacterium]|nr:VWA domain-containing protein [Thermoanaerobaculia bacterium]
MSYEAVATQKTPALIIYLLDCSASMSSDLDGTPRIDHVNRAIEKILVRMVQRSTKGEVISPRYRLAMIAYSSTPQDILNGVQTIDKVVDKGKPVLRHQNSTDTAAAFAAARDILNRELPLLGDGYPAPHVCHLTDGEFNGADPEPIAREIMQMANADGNVLVSNIFVSTNLTGRPITDIDNWPGITSESELSNQYARKLFNMSSVLPQSYSQVIAEFGYQLQPGCRMIIPAQSQGLIELAFAMSGATPTR